MPIQHYDLVHAGGAPVVFVKNGAADRIHRVGRAGLRRGEEREQRSERDGVQIDDPVDRSTGRPFEQLGAQGRNHTEVG